MIKFCYLKNNPVGFFIGTEGHSCDFSKLSETNGVPARLTAFDTKEAFDAFESTVYTGVIVTKEVFLASDAVDSPKYYITEKEFLGSTIEDAVQFSIRNLGGRNND